MTACLINYSQLIIWQSVLSHFNNAFDWLFTIIFWNTIACKMNQNFTYKRKGSRGVHPKMKNCAIIYCTLNREMTHTLKKSCQAPQGFKSTIKAAYMNHIQSLLKLYSWILWKNLWKCKSLFIGNLSLCHNTQLSFAVHPKNKFCHHFVLNIFWLVR